MLYSLMKHVIVGPALKTLYTPHVEGIEHIPDDGPAILASNHLSFSDSFFLPLVVDRKITFLAKSDYFEGPGVKGWMTKQFFSGVGQVPVDRSGGRRREREHEVAIGLVGELQAPVVGHHEHVAQPHAANPKRVRPQPLREEWRRLHPAKPDKVLLLGGFYLERERLNPQLLRIFLENNHPEWLG